MLCRVRSEFVKRATVSIWINVHYIDTQTIWRRQPTIPQETQGQSAPIQLSPTLGRISQHKRLFHISATSSKVCSRWARIEDDISAEKKRSENCLAFAFESTSTWKLKSPQRRNWQNVTVSSSDNAENSDKNLSIVKPFFLDGRGQYTVTRRKTLSPEVIVKSKCSNEDKIQPSFRETWSPLRGLSQQHYFPLTQAWSALPWVTRMFSHFQLSTFCSSKSLFSRSDLRLPFPI